MQTDQVSHTFVICAYKTSPYLENCVKSLVMQEQKSKILIVTSTMNEKIKSVAQKYDIDVKVRDGEPGIALDWNYALHAADTKYITIAHQDDIYCPDYSRMCVKYLDAAKHPLIFFSDYAELRSGYKVCSNRLLRIKRLMLWPLKCKWLQYSRFVRRKILSFGSPICCPSVTYVKSALPKNLFQVKYKGAVDWQAWERISKRRGAFVYCPYRLMYHRIHKGSETTKIIADQNRGAEDYEMLRSFWGEFMADLLFRFYKKSQDFNKQD